jgi:hypothetical protein
MPGLSRQHNVNQLKKANKTFNKSNNITKKLKGYNQSWMNNPLDRKVDTYENFVKKSKK